ncbi:O-acetyl-ADP-ribose deacetylase (regulator of RNase III), contains Macro domain [Marinobacter sp. DSM 26671]|jgi:O-acetyl-ADP-ribose deacetylase (regulator of RNase III)|uniref:Macro domain-containing protein n=2 Tax=Marinobacter TaxID=2742 RepID=A0A3D8H1J6_9GAMM|nr:MULTISPECIES: macro domain-containing protein [Marinobacter]MCP4062378.1 macro domain-containing protein [Gammaproteobacteria bacterium]MEC7727595.1 macro domain-containing protein [Pseudomonadota bacterium]AKV95871.1 Appr-1-p processing protein [Marinobacter sp. CP1]EHJ04241.1 appr-1-p processing domain-containing protein [Marinobacter manganoxydans MnI7-9]MAK49050.1 macro domain-containing protein [Marinobacter sp.]|tara:strand:- start:479 stop:1012 length:534 start_codon:yes stop_codon:yes gene_type:complete
MTVVKVECIRGNIAEQQDMDVIVNAANAELLPGSGVAGAIHSAAGPGLAEECRALAPIRPGQAVISSAHELPNQHVIHCLGPVYGVDEPSDRLLAECFRNALLLADRHKLTSIAFPAISTGVFGYPLQDAAAVAMKAVSDTLAELNSVRLVRFVLFSDEDRKVFEQALELESGLSGR